MILNLLYNILHISRCTEDSKYPVLFTVHQECGCDLIITDTSESWCEYDSMHLYKYEDTITLDIITLQKVNSINLIAIIFTTHLSNEHLNEIKLPISNDGAYDIYHIIIPTHKWYKALHRSVLDMYDNIYVSDGKSVYVEINKRLVEYDPLNFIKNELFSKTTIVKSYESIFLTCYLWKCYIYLCSQLVSKLNKRRRYNNTYCNSSDLDSLAYKRDLVWVAFNAINCLADNCDFERAEKLLEDIQSCKGICTNNVNYSRLYYKQQNSHGVVYTTPCGCK